MKSTQATVLDISTLPEHARQELTDFYQFLARKYATSKQRRARPVSKITQFFQQYQVDMSDYRFNRDEAHER